MGKINNAFTHYFRNPRRFADLYNGIFFQGDAVIAPRQLKDASEVYHEAEAEKVQCAEDDGKTNSEKVVRSKRQERIRDIKMRMETGELLLLLAQENQELVDYTMPFRCLQYDTMEYSHQLENIRSSNVSKGEWNSWVEKACGMKKTDRLIPIYTLCVYHGTEEWDGPRSLKDMMDFGTDKDGMSRMFADYPLRLWCLNEVTDFQVFHTEIRLLFQVLKFRKNKEELLHLLNNDESYQHMDADTLEVISVMLNAPSIWKNREKYMKRNENQEREEYDMCQALTEIVEEAKNDGREEGEKVGENRLSKLIFLLMQKGENEIVMQITQNENLRKEYYRMYGI